MPMTFDQYSHCAFQCQYCFAFFRKTLGFAKSDYLSKAVHPVNTEKVKQWFLEPETSEFGPYVRKRLAMQWGGMADPFCPYEHRYGVGLELIKFFREIEYPISFSTKGAWWTEDARYVDLFRGAEHFNVKVSIITLDTNKASKIEKGVPGPEERLKAIGRIAKWGIGGVTLRLRPFILGVSSPSYLELIQRAAEMGAEAVSTEFLCVEERTPLAKARYRHIGKIAGYNLLEQYKLHSPGQSGYLRGSREMKRPFMEAMYQKCEDLGLRFYVSDAHFKELCANGSCCGLRTSWNYSRGQFTEALLIARTQGRVYWSDIAAKLDYADTFSFCGARGFNTTNADYRAQFHGYSMSDWMRYHWNNVNSGKGPYKYFGGVLYPVGRDEQGDVIYEYRGD